ncbi:hypothetical protein MKW92_039058 [Papaver armeniacum]|nr:hypothetical protein MKW92_039058 [Papaver armeniacum]
MASINKLSYQRLIRNEGYEYVDYEEEEFERQIEKKRSWFKFKRLGSKKKSKLKIPGLRRFLRRKSRFFSSVRGRLKEKKHTSSDLFPGNYFLTQVNPTSLKSFNNKYNLANRGMHSFNPKYSSARNFV